MKCKDLEGLLLTYANGELKGTLKEFIEYHLNECANCRLSLSEYQKARERLLALRQTPEIPISKQAIMTQIKAGTGVRRWLRPVAMAVPVLIIVAIALSLQFTGVFSRDTGIISRAYAASSGLESFRYTKVEYYQDSPDTEPELAVEGEILFKPPDQYHFTSEVYYRDTPSNLPPESITIRIGDQVYVNTPFVAIKLDESWFEQQVLSEKRTIDFLNLLAKTETLKEEIINGTECYHYIGNVDIDKLFAYLRPQQEIQYYRMDESLYGQTKDIETFIEDSNTFYLDQDITYEFWVGKADYLLRQVKCMYRDKNWDDSENDYYIAYTITNYSNFNEDFSIEAPLDESGKILNGWSTYTIEPLVIPENPVTEKPGSPRPSITGIDDLPDFIDPDFQAPYVLTSYRASGETWEYVDGEFTNSVNSLMEYAGHNQLHQRLEYQAGRLSFMGSMETIVSGNKAYTNMGTSLPSTSDFDETLTAADTIRQINQLYSIEILPEVIINGTECYHVRGILDVEPYLEWFYPEWEKSFEIMNEMSDGVLDSEEGWETIQKIFRSKEIVYEYWFGKEDYLIRKHIRLERDLTTELPPVDDINGESTVRVTKDYYDFNQEITIKEPLDESGNLLDGWVVSTLE